YTYDERTFRLTRLLTTRNSGVDILQDLNYTFDPVGNIVEQADSAQETHFFSNAQVSPNGKYTYDALYRLLSSSGRELVGIGTPGAADITAQNSIPDTNASALRGYTQSYEYDELGNIEKMIHTATGGSWTRHYHYNSGFTTNQLLSTSPDDIQPTTDEYTYDAHGNMTSMPHLATIGWDYADRMQSADLGGGGNAYYTYDAGGNRVRKVIDKGGGLIHERIYLGDWEVYRESQSGTVQLERETLHISDDTGRIALADTLTIDSGSPVGSPTTTIRYQHSNHLGSAALELDDTGAIISYEEYHPFGSTAYRSGRSAAEVSLKRYRYVGKERDDETGLYYYGARYYAAWLARFVSVDPLKDDYPQLSPYQYAGNRPISFKDIDGKQSPGDRKHTNHPKPISNSYIVPIKGGGYQDITTTTFSENQIETTIDTYNSQGELQSSSISDNRRSVARENKLDTATDFNKIYGSLPFEQDIYVRDSKLASNGPFTKGDSPHGVSVYAKNYIEVKRASTEQRKGMGTIVNTAKLNPIVGVVAGLVETFAGEANSNTALEGISSTSDLIGDRLTGKDLREKLFKQASKKLGNVLDVIDELQLLYSDATREEILTGLVFDVFEHSKEGFVSDDRESLIINKSTEEDKVNDNLNDTVRKLNATYNLFDDLLKSREGQSKEKKNEIIK
ncbi:MAG: RHS repeat-associated core domain-containing protein, partial [Reichenbachiella sp.]